MTPQRVYVFVQISEQAGIISKHDINWSLFIFQTECVHCAVRAQVRGGGNLPPCLDVICMQNIGVGELSYCHAKVTDISSSATECDLSVRRD